VRPDDLSLLADTVQRLSELDLRMNRRLLDSGLAVLRDAVRSSTTMRVLHLQNVPFTEDGLACLLDAVEQSLTMVEIHLKDNGVAGPDADACRARIEAHLLKNRIIAETRRAAASDRMPEVPEGGLPQTLLQLLRPVDHGGAERRRKKKTYKNKRRRVVDDNDDAIDRASALSFLS
jgi:hypothetical protein